MAVIPIVLEGQRQPVRRPNESKFSDCGRRGSYGRIIAAANCSGANDRKGSYIRKGSYGRIPLTATTTTRRGSYGRIAAVAAASDGVRRRGSVGRTSITAVGTVATAAAASAGSGPAGRKLEDTVRRGSIARRGSETKFQTEALLNRRSSGAGSRHLLVKKGSRQNLKSFQIKISIEGEDENEDKAEKSASNKNKNEKCTIVNTEKVMKNEANKENVPSTTKDKKEETNRWKNVDRGVAQVRGGGGIQFEPIVNTVKFSRIGDVGGGNAAGGRQTSISTMTASGGGGGSANSTTRTGRQPLTKVQKPVERVSTLKQLAEFSQEATDRHNKYRTAHGAKPVSLDGQLSKHAQKYAEKLANSCTFQHSGDPNYGENLYWAWSSDPNFCLKGTEAVDSWYEESLHSYDYSQEPTDTESGHFTQLVWKRSERIGVGLAKSSAGRHIVVIKYDPPGNFIGQYTHNVMKPIYKVPVVTKQKST